MIRILILNQFFRVQIKKVFTDLDIMLYKICSWDKKTWLDFDDDLDPDSGSIFRIRILDEL